MLKYIYNILFTIVISASLFAQEQQVLGTWDEHLSLKEYHSVLVLGNDFYAATEKAIVKVNANNNAVERLSKVNALNDNIISTIGKNESKDALLVGYENGNVDVIIGSRTINYPQIKNSSLVGSKTINGFFGYNEFIYVATSFGIVKIDLDNEIVTETYMFGPNGSQIEVSDVTVFNNSIYAATTQGLFNANLNHPFLVDFNAWSPVSGLTIDNYNQVEVFNNVLYTNKHSSSDSLLYLNSGTWMSIATISGSECLDLIANDNKLVLSQIDTIVVINNNQQVDEKKSIHYPWFTYRPASAVSFNGTIWMGDRKEGIFLYQQNGSARDINLNTPFSNNTYAVEIDQGVMYVAAGFVGFDIALTPGFAHDGVFKKDAGNWSYYNFLSLGIDSTRDFCALAIHPENAHLVAAGTQSFRSLMFFENDQVKNSYNHNNSIIKENSIRTGISTIRSLQYDEDGNLWMANSFAKDNSNPLIVLTEGGQWRSFGCQGTSFTNLAYSCLIVDEENNYKWALSPNGILVLDDNKTPLDASDDFCAFLDNDAGTGNLPPNPNCLAEDLDGEIWIGTGEGIAVIYNPKNIFDGNGNSFDANRIIIQQDGNNQYLLETESITSIAVDGANRKWIGTKESGVFLVSEDGQDLIQQFNNQNSPLYNNFINDIAIDGSTGEVFFATQGGLMSFKSDATATKDDSFGEVLAYPNPVKPDYNGLITIKGLMRNSNVKITDLSGNLVYATESNGGLATWDGTNFNNERVATGIYLVLANDESGFVYATTKIMFVH